MYIIPYVENPSIQGFQGFSLCLVSNYYIHNLLSSFQFYFAWYNIPNNAQEVNDES